jgi:hypothetical protein
VRNSYFIDHRNVEFGTIYIGSDHIGIGFTNTAWVGNSATSGAGVYISDFAQDVHVHQQHCAALHCAALHGAGGAGGNGCFFIEYVDGLRVADSVFKGNHAASGAALHVSSSEGVSIATGSIVISSSRFYYNTANYITRKQHGGRWRCYDVRLADSAFEGNSGAQHGGAYF